MNHAAEQRVAVVCETVSAHLTSVERPLAHLLDLLNNVSERGGRLEGEALGWALADAEAIAERIDAAAEYVRAERGSTARFRVAK